MKEIIVAKNKITEIILPQGMIESLKDQGMRQFTEYYNFRPVYFRTPLDIKNPVEGPGYQWEANTSDALEDFKNLVLMASEDIYAWKLRSTDIWYLLQRKENWMKNPKHNHPSAEVLAICYLNIKEGESAIDFYDSEGNSERFYPKANSVIISKGDVYHRPVENESEYDRLSLNIQFNKEVAEQQLSETTSESERRMAICNQCPKLNPLKFCNECACFMPLKTKLPFANCPLGKWESGEANG